MQRIKQCKVCGAKEKICFHYGVCTCRACGAFFRRFIENEGECKYKCKCSKENKGGKSETNLAKCKKCRLDKCLSVGMRKSEVRYLRHDICREAMREQNNNEVNVNFFLLERESG
uniref:Nuclear receptor domain-containing protein n=1 Tax=Meloidogyne enterolobii TaxID=390850 RepID=A0A6V7WC07_MELEN|nr:unnamed protein product [Meloidogyne enterolobii]CAD2184528.1 unnamed protein product [Meloidogyne enterolobii]